MILYHYTSADNFRAITRSGLLHASDPWTTMDAAYGHGWYFTDRPPDKCDAWTVAHCWRSLDVFQRVEYYLKFDIPDHLLKNCREHVWMIDQSDWNGNLNNRWPVTYIEGKKNQGCSKAVSCLVCDVISKVKSFLGW